MVGNTRYGYCIIPKQCRMSIVSNANFEFPLKQPVIFSGWPFTEAKYEVQSLHLELITP